MSDVNTARPQPSCASCDFMRHEGQSMRCFWNPPVAMFLGAVPAKIQGAPPMILSTGVYPEVHPGRFCRHHPDLRGDAQPQSPGIETPAAVLLPHEGTAH